ncbi:MAG: hypothetical protein HY721_08970, partial [Planctomycetes bacterium]|nr:hypothetical protein [Planctomycetota bacterium]
MASAAPASVRVVYRFDAPRVERGKGGDRVRITSRIAAGGKAEELPAWGEPGAPVLPRRRACILLPEGTTAAGVVVRPSPPVAVARNLRLALAAEEHAPADRAQGGGRAFVRGASPGAAAGAAVPERTWTYHGVGWKHGRAVALLGLRPVGCDASTGAVDYRSSIEVEVLLRPAPAPPRAPRLPGRDLELASLVDNPELLLLEARTAALPAAGGGVGRG